MRLYPISTLTRQKENLYYVITAIIFSLSIWILFKQFYPYPFITIDSYYYIGAAYKNANAGSWPIGYSKFIRLVGFISHSHTLLVTTQYLILQASLIYFFITIRTVLHLNKITSLILFIILFFNPLFIYGSNHIMSDLLFCSLSLCWVCELLHILKRPTLKHIITQAVLLTAIFSIRYTALFFPIISVIVLLISKQSAKRKITSIILTFLLLGLFIQFTRIKMEEASGVRQFSSAAGWKQACNALYMYANIAETDSASVPERFKMLHQLTRAYFKSQHTHVDLYHIDQEFTTGSFYVAAYESPLMQYLRIKKGEDADIFDFKNIAPFGSFFNSYGNYLITNHPISYFLYVVIPDIIAYISPFPEIYGMPNDLHYLWSNYMGAITKKWFGINNISMPESLINIRGYILRPYPTIFSIIHLTFFISLVAFSCLKYYKQTDQITKYALATMISICLGNFVFTVLSAASVLRFQFMFIILEFTITLFLIELIYKNAPSNQIN